MCFLSSVNIPEVIIANIMGIMILSILLLGNSWQAHIIFKENPSLKIMLIISFILCISDPICFLADGKPGMLNRFLVYFFNICLYIGNMLTTVCWCHFVMDRMMIKKSAIHKLVIYLCVIANFILIIINFFFPIIFSVDSNNVYQRESLYWIVSLSYIIVMFYGFFIYLYQRIKGEKLRFLPIWAFLVPIITGFSIQSLYYGVSTITPFITIGLVCVFINLQNEFIYRDKLTGLYNRFYLDIIGKMITNNKSDKYTIMMLDINRFKKINDTYGHSAGDQALIILSKVMNDVIGVNGECIRYAGDEFIVFLYTQNEETVKDIINKINLRLANVDIDENVPFKMSVSAGYFHINDKYESVAKIIDKVDYLMYEDKQKRRNNER